MTTVSWGIDVGCPVRSTTWLFLSGTDEAHALSSQQLRMAVAGMLK
jgi:hypothetical protein